MKLIGLNSQFDKIKKSDKIADVLSERGEIMKEKRIYENEKDINETDFVKMIENKLNASYPYVVRNNVKVYTCEDKRRIVALQTSENVLAICATTKKDEEKKHYVVGNKFNPSFFLFTSGEINEQKKSEITFISRMLKSAGDINLLAIQNNHLLVGQFDYEREYKIPNNMFYNEWLETLNIKSIAAITRDKNKIHVKIADKNGQNCFRHSYEIDSISITGNHSNYANMLVEEESKKLILK